MNKIAISLIALAALSTASLASSNRNYDIRETDSYMGHLNSAGTLSTSRALAVQPLHIKKFRAQDENSGRNTR